MLRNKKMKKAFTLVEMMIVVIIIGILMAALLPKLTGAQASARDIARKVWIEKLSVAMWLYYGDNAVYPNSWDKAYCVDNVFIKDALISTYIKSIPKEPQKQRIVTWFNGIVCTWNFAYIPIEKNGQANSSFVIWANAERSKWIGNYVLNPDNKFKIASWENDYTEKLCNQVTLDWKAPHATTCTKEEKDGTAKLTNNMLYVRIGE